MGQEIPQIKNSQMRLSSLMNPPGLTAVGNTEKDVYGYNFPMN